MRLSFLDDSGDPAFSAPDSSASSEATSAGEDFTAFFGLRTFLNRPANKDDDVNNDDDDDDSNNDGGIANDDDDVEHDDYED